MAAKVAVVVVPTVLGIASIRVHTVKERTAEGLLPRERVFCSPPQVKWFKFTYTFWFWLFFQLNIYTPLPQSAEARVVPERPGIIQSGVTTARESIQPFVQASKNAYSSVKTGTSKLCHTLEDVYYYLKDPPPEFLPRFGTITMAGLLGMFLARKGSRFKRTAVPLGLMSAAASMCYPAQAVAAVKLTGKKVYAAGQWSGTVVSSLFVSKPREPASKAPTSPQPQAEVPVVGSAGSQEVSEVQSTKDASGQSTTIPQEEAASPESAPVSDQPVVAPISEEVSPVTLAETPPSQTPSDTGTSSEGLAETKQGSSQLTPEVSTPPLEPEPVETAPIEATSIETTSAEPTPAELTSLDSESSVPVVVPDPPHEDAADETAAEHNRADGSGFKADPALMDFGQSSPEDEDLYSTRS